MSKQYKTSKTIEKRWLLAIPDLNFSINIRGIAGTSSTIIEVIGNSKTALRTQDNLQS
jgi:hypothetical protein